MNRRDDAMVEQSRLEHDMTEWGVWDEDQPSAIATEKSRRGAMAPLTRREIVALRYMLEAKP